MKRKLTWVSKQTRVQELLYSEKELVKELKKLFLKIKTSQVKVVDPGWGDPSELYIDTDDGQRWVFGFYVNASRGV